MRIAYVMYPGACYVGAGDGSKMQAVIWGEALIERGHTVEWIDPWKSYNWKEFDIVHVYGIGLWNYDFIHWGSRINSNFVFSPIIDTNKNMSMYKLATHIGCEKLRLYSQNYMLRKLKSDIKLFYARSEHESKYLREGYGIPDEKISLVPLAYRFDKNDPSVEKEPFCLFVGTMTQERKNTTRLIEAAIKYNFNLVLAGSTGNQESYAKLKKLIGNHSNIKVLGFVSESELIDLYNRAKVFALPSINEGVGLVALEAAVHRCNIVITNIGGPKEYYEDYAYLVNPYDVESIGSAVLKALADDSMQPTLRNHIVNHYNIDETVDMLLESYSKILG